MPSALTVPQPATQHAFLQGGGDMGERTRQFDWSATSAGSPDQWSPSLRATVGLILHSASPLCLCWGSELIVFYNDAFRTSLSLTDRHLGQPASVVWADAWDRVGPLIRRVMATGESVRFDPYETLTMPRLTFSGSPAYGDDGCPNGVLVACLESTPPVGAGVDDASLELAGQSPDASEQYFRRLTDTVPAILWLTEPDGSCSYLNQQWYDLTGQTPAEAEGFGWLEATHPDDKAEAGRLFLDANERQASFQALYRLCQRDGHYRWVIDKASPRFGATGDYEGMIGTVVDVHEQTMARRQLEASEARLRSLIAAAPAAIGLFVGRDLLVELPNQAFIDIVGKGPDIAGKPLRAVMPELESQPFLQILDEVYTTGRMYQSFGTQVTIVQQGVVTHNYYNITYTPLRNEEGQVYAILDIAIDVTQEIQARRTVEEVQTALQGAIELAQLGTWGLDVATGQVTYSDRIRSWFGFTADAVHLDAVYNPIHEKDRSRVEAAIRNALAPGSAGVYDQEYTLVEQHTGFERIIHAQGKTLFDPQGRPVKIRGTAQDVTPQRRLQYELEQQVAQRTQELQALVADLQRSNENLQQFAYVASHDLQEPLRKIQSFGDLLKSHYGESLGDGVDHLNRMQNAASRMSTLIKDLLSFSRITTQPQAIVPVSLARVVDAVLTDLDLRVRETGAHITVGPLPTVPGDASQLEQVFQNLLSNALKFSRPGVAPVIQISAHALPVADLPPTLRPAPTADSYYRIDVSDNGIGFDEKYLDRIFQVFQRLHGKGRYDGTGIGLAICQKVIGNHGGTITATSQPGQGATFRVYLPNEPARG